MKRVLALLVMLAMLISTVVFSIPVLSVEDNTLDEHNVGIKIPYYSGEVYYSEMKGNHPNSTLEPGEDPVDRETEKANVTDDKIVLDGAINSTYGGRGARGDGDADEWGAPLLHISSKDAATSKGTVPSAENTYFYIEDKFTPDQVGSVMAAGMSADIWFAWDEDYLYLAARVYDPDGHSLRNGGMDVWSGDALEIRVDPNGPNSVVDGHGYNAFNSGDPEHPIFPWKDVVRPSWKETYGANVMNLGIGYTGGGRNSMEIYDMSPRYNPAMEAGADGSEEVLTWHDMGTYYNQENYDPYENPFGMTFGTSGSYKEEVPGATSRQAVVTDYEVAIPWTLMNGSYVDESGDVHIVTDDPKAGDEYGIALTVFNGANGQDGNNASLSWGSGISGHQLNFDYMTSGGSNSMVLVSDELGTISSNGSAVHEHNFADATCDEPATCSTCGYKVGFPAGHKYSHEVVSVPTATSDGVIRSTCTECEDMVEHTIPATAATVWHDFDQEFVKENDTTSGTEFSVGFSYQYVDDGGTPDDPTDDKPIFRGDEDPERKGRQKNAIEYVDGRTVIDLSTGDPGTYFQTETSYTAFGYSYDVKLNDTVLEEDGNKNYANGVYNCFGGVIPGYQSKQYGMKYNAGFFLAEGETTKGYFRIYEGNAGSDPTGNIILAESELVDLGTTWHNFTFMFDPESCIAIFACDGEPVVGAWNEGFAMEGVSQVAIIRRMDVSCMLSAMKTGTYTAFNEASDEPHPPTPTTYKVTCDGRDAGEYKAGDSVELSVPALYEDEDNGVYYRFFTWNVESGDATVTRSDYSADNGTANGRKYTMTMPEGDVTLTAEYVAIGDANTDGEITTRDYSKFKVTVGVGTEDLRLAESCDVDGDGKLTTQDSLRLRQLVAESYTPAK